MVPVDSANLLAAACDELKQAQHALAEMLYARSREANAAGDGDEQPVEAQAASDDDDGDVIDADFKAE